MFLSVGATSAFDAKGYRAIRAVAKSMSNTFAFCSHIAPVSAAKIRRENENRLTHAFDGAFCVAPREAR